MRPETSNGTVIEDGMAGVNGEPFYLVYQEDAFADGEVIVGEKNEVYPLRILEDPRQEGTLTIYKVELMGVGYYQVCLLRSYYLVSDSQLTLLL